MRMTRPVETSREAFVKSFAGKTEIAAWAVALEVAAAERVARVSDLEFVAQIWGRERQGAFGEGSCWEGRWVLGISAWRRCLAPWFVHRVEVDEGMK